MSFRGLSLTDSDTDSDSQNFDHSFRSRSPKLRTMNQNATTNVPTSVPVLKKEYLDMIPEFHGKTELLSRFISISEKNCKKVL